MRAAAAVLAIALSIAACGSAKPGKQAVGQQEGRGDDTVKKLSFSEELFLTALVASAPKSLTKDQLCENGGVCGDDFKAALDGLTTIGFVQQSSNVGYQLTEAGSRYMDLNYIVVRDGDNVSIETRGTDGR